MGSRRQLTAFNRQLKLLSPELVEQEPGLVELGRQYARAVDVGHMPSGSGVQRVLAELRKLAERQARPAEAAVTEGGWLDDLAARRATRLADTANRERPAAGQ